MSYSYTDILNSIISAHAQESPTAALEHYATLSEHCSMTPLLWIQYAIDSTTIDPSHALAKEVMQHATDEFPGCVLLWIYYLDIAVHYKAEDENDETLWEIWSNAMKATKGIQTCSASQPNMMLYLYQLGIKCFPHKAAEIFLQRANSLLLGNESIINEVQTCVDNGVTVSSDVYPSIEDGRKFVSQYMGILTRFEEDVTIAMGQEGIIASSNFLLENYRSDDIQTVYDWSAIVNALGGIQGSVLMGCGMVTSANAFLKYVQGLFQHVKYLRKQVQKMEKIAQADRTEEDVAELNTIQDLIQLFTDLIVPTYERAISECPTVEVLWSKYLKHLSYMLHENKEDSTNGKSSVQQRAHLLTQYQDVSSRAVKNCPYSVHLFTVKMESTVEVAKAGIKVFNPDDVMQVVKEAMDGGFLATKEQQLEIYLAACKIVKQRILELVSKGTSSMTYDEEERIEKEIAVGGKKRRRRGETIEMKKYLSPLEEEIEQDIQDLTEDLKEMFDAADSFMRKKFPEWTEGRYMLQRERASFVAHILTPLLKEVNDDEPIQAFEKLVRIHHPPHPNAYRDYIQYLSNKSYVMKNEDDEDDDNEKLAEAPGMVSAKFRFIRNLYCRALNTTKKDGKDSKTTLFLDYEHALKQLCTEFLAFEKSFGSDASYTTASKLVKRKLSLLIENGHDSSTFVELPNAAIKEHGQEAEEHGQEYVHGKRKRDAEECDDLYDKVEHVEEQTSKRAKLVKSQKPDSEPITFEKVEEKDTNMEDEKKVVHIWPIKPKPEQFVKIGKLDYPAHPYTVHISNLSSETIDGDLYDLFHAKCGAIVHARIFREKGRSHGKLPKSKCAGLIQFEERESVEKAIALSGEIGLHEKLLIVERSHQPAVGKIPPGTHRVKPKGEGKHSKRNIKKKEKSEQEDGNSGKVEAQTKESTRSSEKTEDKASSTVAEKKKSTTPNVLAFRPRNVGRKKKVGLK